MTNKNDDNICKITIYDNERIKVQNNYFNPFSNTKNNYVNTKIVHQQ